jgi:hypothetical protein
VHATQVRLGVGGRVKRLAHSTGAHRGVDRSRVQAVDANIVPAEFGSECARHPDDAVFAGRVVDLDVLPRLKAEDSNPVAPIQQENRVEVHGSQTG